MHIPDNFLDPKVSLGLMGAAVALLSYCLAKVKTMVTALAPQEAFASVGQGTISNLQRTLTAFGRLKFYQMSMIGALIFIFQLFDFPVGFGATGHLMGGALAAIVLGPYAGALTLASVLTIQAVFMGDGGLSALGANIVNMAMVGSFFGYFIYIFLKSRLGESWSIALTAWLSVVLSALAYSFIVGGRGAQEMIYAHLIVGLAEALITLAAVKLFRSLFPE
jgi:cobalt/nickel transport system permease protein